MAHCESCGTARPDESAPIVTTVVSCWTCTNCGTRSPGQPTIMGLCSGCHFELRIKTTVRATPEEVAANLKAIREMLERVAIRMHV